MTLLRTLFLAGLGLLLPALPAAARQEDKPVDPNAPVTQEGESPSRLPDEVVPPRVDLIPDRPVALELFEPFLGPGPLSGGFEIPGGQVLQPSVLFFGTIRSAVQEFDDGTQERGEWANRLDLFGQLKLSGTERFVAGVRPLDNENEFSGYYFEPDQEHEWVNGFDIPLEAAFFEGDLGEILPFLDSDDSSLLDFGFSVGRQAILVQDGIFINDAMDSAGLIRNNILLEGTNNTQLTGLFAWNNIHRNDNLEDDDAKLVALLMERDLAGSTLELNGAYVDSSDETKGDGLYGSFGTIQRIRDFNTTFRVAVSRALDHQTAQVSSGALLFSEISLTPHHTHDLVYLNGFLAINRYSSPARGPGTGGPLGRVGILFAAQGLGRYGAPLSNRAEEATGGALGYQMIFSGGTQQVILEAGGRASRRDSENPGDAWAVGSRYQVALHHLVGNLGDLGQLGQRTILQLDGFVGKHELRSDPGWGLRFEVRILF